MSTCGVCDQAWQTYLQSTREGRPEHEDSSRPDWAAFEAKVKAAHDTYRAVVAQHPHTPAGA